MEYDLAVLTNPEIFELGRLPAVSDHDVYRDQAETERGESSLRRSLDGRWKFAYAENLAARPQGFAQPDYDVSGWAEINVPGHIQTQGWGVPQYVNTQYPWDGHEALRPPQIPERHNPVGSYVTFFTVPESWRDMRVTLVFHGVESAFFVWLNGKLLGYCEDSFTASRFDLTKALQEGENRLAVEVFRFCSGSWMEDQDFWRFSGIFRGVTLEAQPSAHVDDLFARAIPAEDLQTDELTLEATLLGSAQSVRAELLDADGLIVDACTTPAQPAFTLRRQLAAPRLWSAEQPNLYTLRLTLLDESGATLEVAQTEVGFRRFELKDGLMCINGKRILFRGVNRHEFSHRRGRAVTEQEMLWDICTLKRNNINAVRTSHYPNHDLWYRLCDRYGIYLIAEANLESHGTWLKMGKVDPDWVVPGDRPDWQAACIDRAQSMLEARKNHPSILMWSCGNESYGGRDLYEMSQFYRRRDPSRLAHYEGVNSDRRYNDTSDIESRMYPTATEIAQWIETHSDKPFILCEYCHAMGNSCGDLSDYMALERRYARYQGDFIWDWIDQAIAITLPDGRRRLACGGDFGDQPTDRNFCTNGLVFANRTLTPKMQEVKYQYQNVRITPDEGGVTLANDSLFDDLSGFRLRWTLSRDGAPVAEGALGNVRTAPGASARFALPLPPRETSGEYALTCALCLKNRRCGRRAATR